MSNNIDQMIENIVDRKTKDMQNEIKYLINTVKRIEKFLYYETTGLNPGKRPLRDQFQPELFDPEDYEQETNDEKEFDILDSLKDFSELISKISKVSQSNTKKMKNEDVEKLNESLKKTSVSLDAYAKELIGEILGALKE